MLDFLAILLIIALIVWVVAQFLPASGRLGQFALGLWLLCATVMLCGGRITA